MRGSAPQSARRVVAIQIEKLGDLLVSTPALRSLRRGLPEARITLVASPATVDVLGGWDAVDEIVAFDAGWSRDEQRRFVDRLRTPRIDASVTLTTSWPAYRLSRQLGARRRAGAVYAANITEACLAGLFFTHPVRIRVGRPWPRGAPVMHRAEELLRVTAALGLEAARVPSEIPVTSADRESALALMSSAAASPGRSIVLHLGRDERDIRQHGRWLGDGWMAPDLVRLVEEVQAVSSPAPLVMTAGPEDGAATDVVGAAFGLRERSTAQGVAGQASVSMARDRRFVLLRDLSLGVWAAVQEQAAVVVTPNTAAVHVASAVGRPVVAVYPRELYDIQSQQWAPWMVPCRVLMKADPDVTVRAVADATLDLLRATHADSQAG